MGITSGIMNTFWYRWMEARITGPPGPLLIVKRVVIDICSTPAFDSTFIIG